MKDLKQEIETNTEQLKQAMKSLREAFIELKTLTRRHINACQDYYTEEEGAKKESQQVVKDLVNRSIAPTTDQ